MRLLGRLRHPQATVRWKLTLLYGGMFLVCGAALLAITYALVSHAESPKLPADFLFSGGSGSLTRRVPTQVFGPPPAGVAGSLPQVLPPQAQTFLRTKIGGQVVQYVGKDQRVSDLHQLELWSGIALAIMAVISALLGWFVAGRVLRPLRTITAATQQISEANLHERLGLAGPRDELGKLADTIDGLLERLEAAFDAQRRFVANASHELRTPLTSARALLEMTLADPDATTATFRRTCEQALEENEQQEQLIEALLALAQGQRGIEEREPVDLAAVTRAVLDAHDSEAARQGVRLDSSLDPAVIIGDRRLVERLVSNLVDNAIRHNTHGGRVHATVDGRGVLAIANTGPVVPAEELERLLQPFQRLTPERIGRRDGLGLGLSIVAAIAGAHGAALDIQPQEQGGLKVEVRFGQAEAREEVPEVTGAHV